MKKSCSSYGGHAWSVRADQAEKLILSEFVEHEVPQVNFTNGGIMLLKHLSVFCAALFAIAAQSAAQLTLKMPHKQVSVQNVNGKTVFSGVSTYGKPGQPNLPVYTVTFLLPPGTDPKDISVSIENPVESSFSGKWYVTPASPPIRGDQQAPTGEYPKDMKVYGHNAFFPSSWTGMIKSGKMGADLLLDIAINPCKYNPVTGEMKKLVGGTLTVTIKGQGRSSASYAAPARNAWTLERLRNLIVNPDALDCAPTGFRIPGESPERDNLTTDYAIITTNAIVDSLANQSADALNNFRTYLQNDGYNVIIATETLWGGGRGDSAAENIRLWLQNSYSNNNNLVALLIGDPDPKKGDVPMKMTYPEQREPNTTKNTESDGSTWDIGEAPTDFYYAELSGSWDREIDSITGNIKGDGRFGEFCDDSGSGGYDRFAEILVGRIPFYISRTLAVVELENILTKTRIYAQSSNRDWRKNVLLPMVPMNAGTPEHYVGERIKSDFCIPKQFGYYRLYRENTYPIAMYPDVVNMYPPMNDVPCTEDRVLEAWTHNYFGVVIWNTHGWSSGASEVFSSANAVNLNDSFPSMVFAGSCSNAEVEDKDNLAYSLLVNGAITVVAATRMSTYGGASDYPTTSFNEGFSYAYTGYLLDNKSSGNALNMTRERDSLTDWGPTGWRHCHIYNIYGCPELSLNTSNNTPAPPTYLSVDSRLPNFILNWSDNADNETGYKVEWALNLKGPFTGVCITGSNVQRCDITASPGEKRFFRVRAFNNQDSSCYSNIDSGTTYSATGIQAPPPPDVISCSPTPDNTITLNWTMSPGAQSYSVIRSTHVDGPFATIASKLTGAICTTFTTSSMVPNTTYYFKVIAVNSAGHSCSGVAGATCVDTVPAAPTDLIAAARNSTREITLYWTDSSLTETGFIVYMALSPGAWFRYPVTVKKDIDSITISNLAMNKMYYFRVSAYNNAGESEFSNDASATTLSSNTIIEAENARLENGAAVNTNHKNYSGSGFVDGFITDTAKATFFVNNSAATDKAYGVSFHYSAGNGKSTNMKLYINGAFVKVQNFRRTNDWDTWADISETVTLRPGNNRLTILTDISTYHTINLDYIMGLEPGTMQFDIYASAGANGSISPSGLVEVNSGGSQTFTITPNSDYQVDDVIVDGHSQGAITDYTFNSVNQNHTISATFKTGPCYGAQGGGNGLRGDVFGLSTPTTPETEYCKATDGDIGTYYHNLPQPDGCYTGLDLGTAKVIRKIRFHPIPKVAERLKDGKFQGSNTSSSGGYVDLYTISTIPAQNQWSEVAITNSTAYRWVRYLAPDGSGGAIAEIEFYSFTAPSNLTATAVAPNQINLAWLYNSSNQTGFAIERSLSSNGPWAQIATTGANARTYYDAQLSGGIKYWYRVKAFNATGSSDWSNTASATTPNGGYGNLALGKTVTVSSEIAGVTYSSANVNDDNTTTRWTASSATLPQWVKIDLGSQRTLNEVEMMFASPGNSGDCYDFSIQTSTDNVNWTTRVNQNPNWDKRQTQRYGFSTTTARYVRITINGTPGGDSPGLYEFRVFGM
ncbi:MAG TPA: discoidin domain-containing protein [Chitinispirillaceae bacterium]|nr:discoidin domain-containing protein [Chitinispirillaceae bacterium]